MRIDEWFCEAKAYLVQRYNKKRRITKKGEIIVENRLFNSKI